MQYSSRSLLVISFKYSSVYMSIPNSQFILFFNHRIGDSLGFSEFQSFPSINSLILLLLCYCVSSSYCCVFGKNRTEMMLYPFEGVHDVDTYC